MIGYFYLVRFLNTDKLSIISLLLSIENQIKEICYGGSAVISKVEELIMKVASMNRSIQDIKDEFADDSFMVQHIYNDNDVKINNCVLYYSCKYFGNCRQLLLKKRLLEEKRQLIKFERLHEQRNSKGE